MVVSVTDILVKANRPETQFPVSPEVSIATGAAFDQLLSQFAEALRSLPSAEISAPSAKGSRDTGFDHTQETSHAVGDSPPPIIARDTANDSATFERPQPPADNGAAEAAEHHSSSGESKPANDDHPERDTGLDRAAAETDGLAAAEIQPQASAVAASVAAEQSKVASTGTNPASTVVAQAKNGTETASTAPSPQATPKMVANAGPGAVTPQILPEAANTQGVNNTAPQNTAADKGISLALNNLASAAGQTNTAADGEGETPAAPQSRVNANVKITVTQDTSQPQAQGKSLLAPGTAIAGLMPLDDGAPETVLATVKSNTPAGTNAAAASAVANGTGTADGANVAQTNTTATNTAFGLAQSAVAHNGAASSNGTQTTVSVDSSSPRPLGSAANSQKIANPAQARAMAAATRPAPLAQPVVDQVAVHITKAASQGLDKISIKLSPATLGRIEVLLDLTHDGRVAAVVTVEKSETLDLLQRDARGLERALQEAGLKADSNSLDFNLRGDGHGEHSDSDSDAASGLDIAAEAADGDDASHPTLALTSGYANARANTGGVDIQV